LFAKRLYRARFVRTLRRSRQHQKALEPGQKGFFENSI